MRRCVCPGSFDPFTLGHLDVVQRAAALFDEVVVAVLVNPAKAGRFDAAARVRLVEESLAGSSAAQRVRVVAPAPGLLAHLARDEGAVALVKGVRSASDVEHESAMAAMNRHLAGVETVLLLADARWAHVSSSLVAEVASLGGDVSALVPAPVAAALAARGSARPDQVG